jgi:tetraacyldisaccharide 4'-kinase
VPAGAAFGAVAALRSAGFDRGLRATRDLPSPAVAIGNLSVGGTGKTPVASWVARYYLGRGRTPAVLLRGYGADEGMVHRRLTRQAIVMEDPDRVRAAWQAASRGADAFVLDDGFQRRDVRRDLDVVLVSAESMSESRWPLPAGPWREAWPALRRADLVAVTRKRATMGEAQFAAQVIERRSGVVPGIMAHLRLCGLSFLGNGRSLALAALDGARVLVVSGIGDPGSLHSQVRQLGARVTTMDWPDHHRYTATDARHIDAKARALDYVVITEKDAVKLEPLWHPAAARRALVAHLEVVWERGGDKLTRALDRILDRPTIYPTDARS